MRQCSLGCHSNIICVFPLFGLDFFIGRIIFEVAIYFLSSDKKREKHIWALGVWRDASMWTFERFQHLIETRIRSLEQSPNWERWKWWSEGTSLRWTERLRDSNTSAVSINARNIKDVALDYHMWDASWQQQNITSAIWYSGPKKHIMISHLSLYLTLISQETIHLLQYLVYFFNIFFGDWGGQTVKILENGNNKINVCENEKWKKQNVLKQAKSTTLLCSWKINELI